MTGTKVHQMDEITGMRSGCEDRRKKLIEIPATTHAILENLTTTHAAYYDFAMNDLQMF